LRYWQRDETGFKASHRLNYTSSANIEADFPEALTKTSGGADDEGID